MGLFGNELKGLFGTKIPVSTPTSTMPSISKSDRKKLEKAVRDKVDGYIHPQSELGQLIQKKRELEDKIENFATAAENISHAGEKNKSFKLADHLFIRIGVITHHAIYIGNGMVAHYSKDSSEKITIHKATLEEFADGKSIQCMSEDDSPLVYSPEDAIYRAVSRIHEEKYNLIINNCEQYVRWCRCGRTE